MDLKQLEYFVRVAELGSFTRAAVALDVAQPALSRQVRQLEVELRQNLLIRNGRGAAPNGQRRAVLWRKDGTIVDLGTLGGPFARAWKVNARGDVIGDSVTAAGDVHAFLYRNGVMHDLGTLGGDNSFALGLDSAGNVVGASDTGAVYPEVGDERVVEAAHRLKVEGLAEPILPADPQSNPRLAVYAELYGWLRSRAISLACRMASNQYCSC